MKEELLIECPAAKYELYHCLSQFFDAEIIEVSDNTMGIIDCIKILVEPLTKTIETLGNIIIATVNCNMCTITLKNGKKEFTFKGPIRELDHKDVINMINKMFEK